VCCVGAACACPHPPCRQLIPPPPPPAGRSVVEQYMGSKFEPFVPLPEWKFEDYMGWGEQGDGKLFYGVFIQVGAAGVVGGLGGGGACGCLGVPALGCPVMQTGRLKGSAKKARRAAIFDPPPLLFAERAPEGQRQEGAACGD
jgi:hypothetical protein